MGAWVFGGWFAIRRQHWMEDTRAQGGTHGQTEHTHAVRPSMTRPLRKHPCKCHISRMTLSCVCHTGGTGRMLQGTG